jgi:hypothetical protein
MTLEGQDDPDSVSASVGRSMGRRLGLLALAAIVATIGIAFVVDGLRASSHIRFFFGAVVTLLAAIWAASASRG